MIFPLLFPIKKRAHIVDVCSLILYVIYFSLQYPSPGFVPVHNLSPYKALFDQAE